MRLVLKLAAFLAGAALLLVIIIAGYLAYIVQNRLPDHNAEVRSALLKAEVTVRRDQWGVPHITAEHETDAYFALGYCMAQDRLFQMEVMRRIAGGQLSELLGARTVPVDRVVRSFRLRHHAERALTRLDANEPAMVEALEAYAAGVNDFMDDGPLPWEFTALGIPRRPFTPADIVSVSALLPITFSDGIRGDPLHAALSVRNPDLPIDWLFPGYRYETPVTVMETHEEAEREWERWRPSEAPMPTLEYAASSAAAEVLEEWLASIRMITDHAGHTMGSNAWVVSGEHTASGMPILANDPHVGFTNPSIWYEAHVQYGDYRNYGYHLPPIPLALIGHNEDRAWGLTMWAHDDIDFYAETFHPLDPNRVMYRGEWLDCEVVHETIGVRWGKDVELTVRVTPHGPIVSDLYDLLGAGTGAELAMFWIWQHVEQTDLEAFYRAGHARGLESFAEAMPLVTSPGLNFLYADAEGNIAWWAAGKIPIRAPHVNSKRVLDGALGRDEMQGYVAAEDNPRLINPERGFIVSANNRSTIHPVGEVEDLRGYWQPTDRAGRITDMLAEGSEFTAADFKQMQLDDFAREAPHVTGTLLAILEPLADEMTPREQEVLRRWEAWDFTHGTESIGATIYQYVTDGVFRAALLDEMGPDLLRLYGTLADHWHFFKYFITDPDMPFWNDVTTEEVETREAIVLAGYRDAVAQMRRDLGGSVDTWRWGRAHTLEFKHPFGLIPGMGRFFNIGPFEASGGAEIVNNMLYHTGGYDYDTIAGPSTRRVIDFADPTHSYTILPTGNSGHVAHPNYDDQAEMFMAGEYRVVNFTEEQIAANEVSRMRFSPE